MKLRNKFFMIFSILIIIPLGILTYYAYSHYSQITYSRMVEISDNIFNNAIDETNNVLNTMQKNIQFLTFYSNDDEYSVIKNLQLYVEKDINYSSYDIYKSNQRFNAIFQNLMTSYDYITGIYLFTPSEINFSCSQSANVLAANYTPQNSNWYKETLALDGQLFITSLIDDGMFSNKVRPSVFFSMSISDIYTHEFLGVILISCNSDIFDLSTVNTMPDSTLITVSSKTTDEILYSNIDSLPSDFLQSNNKIKKSDLLDDFLTLTAIFDYDNLYQEFKLPSLMLLLIAFACFCIYAILAFILSKNLIYPIENLSRIMSKQDKIQNSFSSPYMNRCDEIGTLYNEYGNMLEDLQKSIKHDYQDKLILLDAQMKSLEARINSHFLFNTLESINSMAELCDNEPISTMTLSLGNMFRYAIKTKSELVHLEDELNHVNDYITIQSIRFNGKFTVCVDIPDTLRKCKVLKLILQPLVENSFYHGLDYCTCGDCITIQAHKDEHDLYITVSDNGKGMSEETFSEVSKTLLEEASFTEFGHRNSQSIGLKNIHSRITLYYGKGYGLSILCNKDNGTSIQIKLPYHE